MRSKLMLFLLLATIAVGIAHAEPALTAPATVQPADKPICRRQEVTGSIMRAKRVCHTAAEWRGIEDANSANLENTRNGASVRAGMAN